MTEFVCSLGEVRPGLIQVQYIGFAVSDLFGQFRFITFRRPGGIVR